VKLNHDWHEPRASPFVLFSLLSIPFMLVLFDRWDIAPLVFAISITAANGLTLASEVVALRFLRSRSVGRPGLRRWLLQYGLGSLVGSAVLVMAMAAIGVAQDREPFVLAIVFFTRIMNTYLFAFIVDEVVSYRREAQKIRDDLAPSLVAVINTNALLARFDDSRERHELEVIAEHVGRPLHELNIESQCLGNDAAANAIEDFIDGTLRPLSHRMHPTSISVGIKSAAEALGVHLVLDDSALALESSHQLLDESVLLEFHRWMAQTADLNAVNASPLMIRAAVHDRCLVAYVPIGHAAPLDARHIVAGLEYADDCSISMPLKGQFIDPSSARLAQGQPPLESDALPRSPRRWSGTQGPSPYLVGALMLAAAPAITFIANAQVTSAMLAAVVLSSALSVTLAIGLTRLRISGTGWWPPTWIAISWISLGILTGLASATTLVYFGSSGEGIDTGVYITEVIRGCVRLSLPGIVISFFGEFVLQAKSLADTVRVQTAQALETREEILTKEHDRSRLIAEVLHRQIQARLAAAVLLFRLDRRDDAIAALDSVAQHLLPNLIHDLSQLDSAASIDRDEFHSPGLTITYDPNPVLRHLMESQGWKVEAIVAECATNAIRHGSASRLDVAAFEDRDHIILTCTDDGLGPSGDANHRGLGSRVFDTEVGPTQWHIRHEAGSTTASFRFPYQHGLTADPRSGDFVSGHISR